MTTYVGLLHMTMERRMHVEKFSVQSFATVWNVQVNKRIKEMITTDNFDGCCWLFIADMYVSVTSREWMN